MQFSLTIPTHIFFGPGSREELEKLLAAANGGKILVVASEGTMRRSPADKLLAMVLEKSQAAVWTRVQPNPRISDIDACVQANLTDNIAIVIGIGGGSALDQAKATAMGLHTGQTVRELLAQKTPLPKRNNILILLPTTSGTGAEASFGSILSDEISKTKVGLRGKNLAADYAIVDPELTYSMPKSISMITGFDVVTHAVETYISTAASTFTATNSREALVRVYSCLPALFSGKMEHEQARIELSYASMLMGVNLALSTTCMPHRLQYPVGAATNSAHAEGLAALFPAWLRHVSKSSTHKLADCGRWVQVADKFTPDSIAAESFIQATLQLLQDIGLYIRLRDLGVRESDLSAFVEAVSGRLDTDPGYKNQEDILQIYQTSY